MMKRSIVTTDVAVCLTTMIILWALSSNSSSAARGHASPRTRGRPPRSDSQHSRVAGIPTRRVSERASFLQTGQRVEARARATRLTAWYPARAKWSAKVLWPQPWIVRDTSHRREPAIHRVATEPEPAPDIG